MEEHENNVFKQIETTEQPSQGAKEAIISELEIIQNSSHVLELFAGNYFKTLTTLFNSN